MRLSGQFQASLLLFLRKDFGRTKKINDFDPLKSFYARKKSLPLLFFVRLFLILLVGFGWFAFFFAQNLFVKKIIWFEIALKASLYYTTEESHRPKYIQNLNLNLNLKSIWKELYLRAVKGSNWSVHCKHYFLLKFTVIQKFFDRHVAVIFETNVLKEVRILSPLPLQ